MVRNRSVVCLSEQKRDAKGLREIASNELKPHVGLMVAQPTLQKARRN
jgi:hypothetical protein